MVVKLMLMAFTDECIRTSPGAYLLHVLPGGNLPAGLARVCSCRVSWEADLAASLLGALPLSS